MKQAHGYASPHTPAARYVTNRFTGAATPLTVRGIEACAATLSVHPTELWTVLQVETRGCGFFADRRPVILFERHIFSRKTQGRFDAQAPDLSNPKAGGYAGGVAEFDRLERALALDASAALMSASWGLGQVMGFHASDLGYGSVENFVARMMESEDEQLGALAAFIQKNGLAKALRAHDWAAFARGYNGPAYAKNQYDKKLAAAYQRLTTQAPPDVSVREGQLRLMYLGFEPGTPDGALGSHTKGALKKFQAQQQLPVTAVFDTATLDALGRQHGLLPRSDTGADPLAKPGVAPLAVSPQSVAPMAAASTTQASSPATVPSFATQPGAASMTPAPAHATGPSSAAPLGATPALTVSPPSTSQLATAPTTPALSPSAAASSASAPPLAIPSPPPDLAPARNTVVPTPAWTIAPRRDSDPPLTLWPSASEEGPELPAVLEPSTLPEPLAGQLRQRLAQPLDADLQAELSRVVVLRSKAAPELGAPAVEALDLCLTALLAEQPNLSFAKNTRLRIASALADRLYPLRPLPLLRSSSPATQVVLGLGLLLLCCQGLFAFAHQVLTTEATTFFGLPARTLLLVGLCGAVGGAVSLLMRLGDFEKMRGASRLSMLMQGFFKPVIGLYCALFGFALMKSGVLPIQPSTPESALYLYMSVCFLLGFSERLAQDLFIRAGEGLVSIGVPGGPGKSS
ncbi:N-acetylmuramidase domain-containing protein [Pyxidicoccus xibeiensis]|uniref:N-acetylmuramidase domain-containing protein n=1 Tax=Pyxidicoccus xibeiensis TaxID=2906759 RepID=UPI0020A7C762|nr:N-acetylmuramidase domain-containing protein [Pyxidicoccus xibeiensis]MCP3136305.1 N-acetylmuramidase domain-containing protein [Pyxidicoccus xibeiensis]